MLLLWALQEWESPGHCAGCSGGYQVGTTLMVLLLSSSSAILESNFPGLHDPRKERNKPLTEISTEISHAELSTGVFPPSAHPGGC